MKTRVRDKDVATPGGGYAGIGTDKLTDAGQNNKFLTAAQKAALTSGNNADAMHWHAGAGAISAQFGRNGLAIAGQYIEANGIPSNVCGIPLANDGQLLSIGVVLKDVVVGTDVKVRISASGAPLGTVTVMVGARMGFARNLAVDFVGNTELECKVTQGQGMMPSVFVEFRWR